MKDKFKELADVNEEKLEAFDEEFEANQGVIKQFKSTEHLTAAAEGGADSSGNQLEENNTKIYNRKKRSKQYRFFYVPTSMYLLV